MRIIRILAMLLLSGTACAADQGHVNERYDLQKVADGVHSIIASEWDSGVMQSNWVDRAYQEATGKMKLETED